MARRALLRSLVTVAGAALAVVGVSGWASATVVASSALAVEVVDECDGDSAGVPADLACFETASRSEKIDALLTVGYFASLGLAFVVGYMATARD